MPLSQTTALSIVFVTTIATLARGQDIEPSVVLESPEINSTHVHALVTEVRGEIEQIRLEMGKPAPNWPEIAVSGAAPREVYFQALTLLRKADRLCFEQTRQRADLPDSPPTPIQSADVYTVVSAALDRLQIVKEKLGLATDIPLAPPGPNNTATDSFRAVVQANRQLNLLLDEQFSPADVYQQVTFAIAYTARLLAQFPGTSRIPEGPPFERAKTPADVYRRLVGCFQLLRQVANQTGLDMLTLETKSMPTEVAPSDVYDIASLIVSEVAYLHSQLPDDSPPHEAYYPGRKFPSHVYQRVGILEAQLESLIRLVEDNPRWLQDE